MEVLEGGQVAAGGTLALVTVPRATQGSGDTLAALEQRLQQRQDGLLATQQAQHAQLQAQAQGIASQLANAQRELAQVEAEVVTRQQQIRIASETLDRLRRLEGGQYVSVLQIKQQEALVAKMAADLVERKATRGSQTSMTICEDSTDTGRGGPRRDDAQRVH